LHVQQIETQNPWVAHLQLCVDYYRDYGETLVDTYCHDITKDYGSVCETVNNLAAEQINGNSVMLTWSDDSSLPVEGFFVFKNDEQITDDFITDTFYLDENLDLGEYEYYVVAHYTTGCISDKNYITVKIEDNEEIKDVIIWDIVLYPNPFTNEINISNPAIVKNVQITNLTGQKVKEVEFNGKSIKTGSLVSGVYFVVIESITRDKTVYKIFKK
jgi:hypothetical protein